MQKAQRTVEGEGVYVLSIIRPGHVFLTETNSVFALGDTIEFFKVGLRDALTRYEGQTEPMRRRRTHTTREVDLDTEDTDVLGTGNIVGGDDWDGHGKQ